MLLEADKRDEKNAIQLTYSGTTYFIPPNVFLIGTMNTADRSLSMVDYALRRRFSFWNLKPQFDNPLFSETLEKAGVEKDLILKIRERLNTLNEEIKKDTKNLGEGYQIGHSFFCPSFSKKEKYDFNWFERIVKYQIKPLLEEYWFDEPEHAKTEIDRILK